MVMQLVFPNYSERSPKSPVGVVADVLLLPRIWGTASFQFIWIPVPN